MKGEKKGVQMDAWREENVEDRLEYSLIKVRTLKIGLDS